MANENLVGLAPDELEGHLQGLGFDELEELQKQLTAQRHEVRERQLVVQAAMDARSDEVKPEPTADDQIIGG